MKADVERIRSHLDNLSKFTATPGAGCTRLSYTPEFRAACDYVADKARALGMTTRHDAVGNLRARLAGREENAACVMVGSHLDTVINGGNFDGILGVVCGLETVQSLIEAGRRPKRPIEVVVFAEEEGTTFRCPLAGSKAITGKFTVEDLKALKDEQGRSWYEALIAFGLQPDDLPRDRIHPANIHAMLELHIEQGAVLESENLPVGIVEHIAGSENHRIRLTGRANHAGTTPMHLRRDALAAAAEMILAVEGIAADTSRPRTVATVGRIHCLPNAPNVIPGRVEFSIDLRDVDDSRITEAASLVRDAIGGISSARGIAWEMELTGRSPPHPLSVKIAQRIASLAAKAGIPHRTMMSGALHDAATLAEVTDVGMIFVPSREGRSHTPKEWTNPEDIAPGATLLLSSVAALAED